MIHKKLLSLLVLLMTVASGAWAEDTKYTVTFKANGNTKTVENVTLPHTFELDPIIKELYPSLSGGHGSPAGTSASGNTNVTAYYINDKHYANISASFEGAVTVTGQFFKDFNNHSYTLEINCMEKLVAISDDMTEATIKMPQYDVTVNYDIVRDMEIAVNAVMPASIRIQQKQQGGGYEPVNSSEIKPEVKDEISGTAVPMIEKTQETEETGEYTLQLQKKVDDVWTSVSPDVLGPGTYRYVVTGANLYDGTTTTNEFQLIEGYPVTVPAHGFVTYYSDENLSIDDEDAGIYTVQQVTGNKAVLSSAITVAPKNTPLLIYNTSEETKTFLLIPTDGDADEVSYAAQFKGTLEDKEMPGSDDETDYYVCNGFDFAWVKQAGTLAANRCWIEITNQSQGARTINIVFGDGTGLNAIGNGQLTNADGDLYDLNGRKVGSTFNVQRSTLKKGVYIRNGKKVIKK